MHRSVVSLYVVVFTVLLILILSPFAVSSSPMTPDIHRTTASTMFLAARDAVAQPKAPVLIRIGHGFAVEEQVWLMKAKPDITPNQGKIYTLEFTPFRGTDERFKAYEAGQLDGGTVSGSSCVFAWSQGMDFKAYASVSKESTKGFVTQYYVLEGSDIKSPRDLKGKTIGINAFKSSIELWARAVVKKAGLNPDRDVKWAVVPFPVQGEALRTKKIDVGAFPQPFASAEMKKGGLRKLFTSKDGVPFDEELIMLFFNPDFVKKNPDVIRAFLADFVASTKWYLANTRQARQALIDAKFVGIPSEIYLAMEDNYRDPQGRIDLDSLGRLQDVLIENGFQKNRITPRDFVDLSFLPN